MTAEELMGSFSLTTHIENGSYVEKHYEHTGEGRAASGCIYYYVSPEEITKFHIIDCDEYWCYVKGSPLEIWQVEPDGKLTLSRLGIEEGCEPVVYLKKGVNFGSRHFRKETEGTFLSCLTVPRFDPKGFTLFEKEEMLSKYPELDKFYH